MSDRFNASIHPAYVEVNGEDGPYTAVRYGVEVTNQFGFRFHHFQMFYTEKAAQRLVDRINDRIMLHPEWEPAGDFWTPGDHVYGSDAYQRLGGESVLARADVEAEYGPGSYRPDHPGFIGH